MRIGSALRPAFDSALRYLPSTGAVFSIMTLLYVLARGETPSDYGKVVLWFTIAFVLLALGVFAVLVWNVVVRAKAAQAQVHLAQAREALAQSGGRFIGVLANFNTLLEADYKYCTYLAEYAHRTDEGIGAVRHQFERYLDDLLRLTAEIFHQYTGQACAACIKQLAESADGVGELEIAATLSADFEYVYTLHRDPGSRALRREVDKHGKLHKYAYRDNTAFAAIMKSSDEYESFFAMEDLVSMRRLGRYENIRPGWDKFYDAVAVAALSEPGSPDCVPRTIGFLCVDNIGGGFDDPSCRPLLECIASIAYYSIQGTNSVLSELRSNVSE
tara:strand:+ start:1576 stop:2565 length:990 start_codon:yes stop_codon:yes gene_type:complete